MLSAALMVATTLLGACPDESAGETRADCPWAAFSRRLSKEADSGRDIRPLFERLVPGLTAQLKRDAKLTAWHQLWTDSLNRDQNTDELLVEPHILAVLGRLMGLRARGEILNAGLQHTYGYIFSVVRSDGRYRRATWVNNTLEAGFGLPEGLLGPLPKQGTLFTNATYFFARLALADSQPAMQTLDQYKGVPEPLRAFAYDTLSVRRLEERVRVPQITGREIVLRTDVVAFETPQGPLEHLAIYSLRDTSNGETRLISALPVSTSQVQALFAPDILGDNLTVSPRFNAYIEGLTGAVEPLSGSRRVLYRGR